MTIGLMDSGLTVSNKVSREIYIVGYTKAQELLSTNVNMFG